MKHKIFASQKGKYQVSARHPKRRISIRTVLLALIALMILLLLGGISAIIWFNRVEQKKFEEMSAMVESVESSNTSETIPQTETMAAAASEATTEAPKVPTENVLEKYRAFSEKNPDMVGWLKIGDTVINYPVMHTPDDPEKYLHLSFDEDYSYAGVPFADAACTMDSDNIIIYGHNMANGTMFHSIVNYERKDYFQEYPTITFDTLYAEQEYEVMAAFYDRVYYKTEDVFKFYQFIDAENQGAFEDAVAKFKEKSIYDTGVTAKYGDQLITLVTCTYHVENGRFVVVARRAGAE